MSALRTIAATAAALTIVGLLAGCSVTNVGVPGSSSSADGGMMDDSSGEFSASDLMFAQMMIPHHEQAVEMADLAPTRSTNQDVVALAARIKAAQSPEIEQMKEWLSASGSDMPMDGMDMGTDGMMSDDEMSALEDANGATFDRLFLEAMIAHHEGAIELVDLIADSSNSAVKTLGENIVESQTAEIAEMETMLAAL